MKALAFSWKSVNKSSRSDRGWIYQPDADEIPDSPSSGFWVPFFQLVTAGQSCYLHMIDKWEEKWPSISPASFTREKRFSKIMPGILPYLVGIWKTQRGMLWGWRHRILSWRLLGITVCQSPKTIITIPSQEINKSSWGGRRRDAASEERHQEEECLRGTQGQVVFI